MQLNAAEDPEMAALLGSYGDMAAKRLGFVPGTTPAKQRPALPQTPLHPQRIPMPTPPEGYRFAGITDGPLLLHENLLVWWDTLSKWCFARVIKLQLDELHPVVLFFPDDNTEVDNYPCNRERQGSQVGEWSWVRIQSA